MLVSTHASWPRLARAADGFGQPVIMRVSLPREGTVCCHWFSGGSRPDSRFAGGDDVSEVNLSVITLS
ncbi:hypothetical protein [Streptomyces luteolus]|uniref:Uncharacterized protein n=1 Tax=Streptomyces luteolus TaxID=3043615 RepID=A0ABT6SRX1_9ACTN|nr:hypothetical protein [Streptomyces sp. B-S-A12]MDI3417594.1 hypothetical protein [Streptomyces sp. B-S-A12]